MAKEFSRTRRVGEQMQRELAQLIQREVKDPRLGLVTVSGVEVSRDYSVAKVYVTVLGTDTDPVQTLAILNKVSGYLRHELGRRMVLRTVPALTFHYDTSVEHGSELSRLIDEAVAKDRDSEQD